jgi:hypothetical protein
MEALRAYAMQASGDMLKGDTHPELWNGEEWRMVVTDEAGREIIVLRFSAEQMARLAANPAYKRVSLHRPLPRMANAAPSFPTRQL